jgi:hypothetical protein
MYRHHIRVWDEQHRKECTAIIPFVTNCSHRKQKRYPFCGKIAGIKQFGGFFFKPLEINRVGIGMAVLLGCQAGNRAFVP